MVDITTPVDTQTWDKLATPPGTSSAEEVQQLVPQGTPVVKAFNTTFSGTLVGGEVAGQQLEQLGFLHISLQQPHGLGFGSAIKLVTP